MRTGTVISIERSETMADRARITLDSIIEHSDGSKSIGYTVRIGNTTSVGRRARLGESIEIVAEPHFRMSYRAPNEGGDDGE